MRTSRILFRARRVLDSVRYRDYRLKNIDAYLDRARGKKGLEIGGPSGIFRENGLIPLYPVISELDGCNFSDVTIWEGKLVDGGDYGYDSRKTGRQYILDAVDLASINDDTYDIVLCSHVLEHVANPLKAVSEMRRVLKNDGSLLLIVPNKNNQYDHDRRITPFGHLLKDYGENTSEDDLTHLDEILRLSLDPKAKEYGQLRQRSLQNFNNRALHHHVFDQGTLRETIEYSHFKITSIAEIPPYHIVVLAEKCS